MQKIALITGSTNGIGKETAKGLAQKGYKVIIHGRNEKKVKIVIDEIKNLIPTANLDFLICNLLSFKDIKKMCENFYKKYTHLDVLIHNAGAVFSKERLLTEDNQERTLQLNVFSPFLLTNLLLPALQNSKSSRIIMVSSASHSASRQPNFNDMLSKEQYGSQSNYSLSKLYVIWIGQHFSKILKEREITNVTCNITHPGAVATTFGQNEKKGFLIDIIYKIGLLFMSSPEKGARSEIYLASSPSLENVTGKFYSHKCKLTTPNPKYYSKDNEQLLWNYCENITRDYYL